MPRNNRDLTGQQFGLWGVLERAGTSANGAALWRCRCACGRLFDVLRHSLVSGRSTRCRYCGRAKAVITKADRPKPLPSAKPPGRQTSRLDDLTWRQFGRWKVLYHVGFDKHNNALWKCECECGIQATIQAGNLRSGRSTQCRSCGARGRANRTTTREER